MADPSTMYLLGAGASAEAGLPLSVDLTKLTLDRVSAGRRADLAHALHFVVATMVAYDTRLGEGLATDRPDIERVASAVVLLAKRNELELTPFVGAWDATLTSMETRAPKIPSGLERDVAEALTGTSFRRGHQSRDLAKLIEQLVVASALGRSTSRVAQQINDLIPEPNARKLAKVLHDLAASSTVASPLDVFGHLLVEIVSGLTELLAAPSPDAFDYLAPLVGACGKSKVSTIATLNYDLGIETVAEQMGVPISTGVANWSESGELDFTDGAVRLLKLHGSLDWRKTESRGVRGLTGADLSSADSPALPFIVFGQREKLRPEGPFLQLLEEFRRSVARSEFLVVIGYAFRDPHINEVIGRWLMSNDAARLVVVDKLYSPKQRSWGRPKEYRRLLEAHRRADGSVAVAFIQESASSFLARMASEDADRFIESLFAEPARTEERDASPIADSGVS